MHSKMFSPTTLAVVASTLLSTVHGHLFIQEPAPIEGSAPKDPLDPSGSNFPCHGIALPGSGGQSMAAGSSNKLTFQLDGGVNTAVHGGGSCQLSVTYETDAEKIKDPANWRVIHSIEGGCPTNAPGNLDVTGAYPCGDPMASGQECVNSFDFNMPEDMPSGQATLAWTWFNTIGNREMYMNCAAVDISGGSDDTSFYNELPQMFVANLAAINSCPTTEETNVKFPNPGNSVESSSDSPYPIDTPVGEGCDANSGGSGGPAPDPKPSSMAPAPTYSSMMPTMYPTITSNPGGVFAPGASTTFSTYVVTTSAPAAGGSPPAGGSVPCSTDGAVVCIGASQWGMCSGGMAYPMELAAGTTCSGGVIARRAVEPEQLARRHPHHYHHRRRAVSGGSN